MWIFGYGSLIWKVDFPYEKKVIGYVKGYERRFYQHSTDHRGTKENPGRVVTLISSKNLESKVYGIAYKIKETDINEVVNHLDYREKGGYQRVSVLFYPKAMEDHPFSIVIYLASLENPQYAGYADIGDIAKQVIKCSGPSGKNIDYVLNLAQSMRSIAPEEEDKHLFDLEKAVLGLLSNIPQLEAAVDACFELVGFLQNGVAKFISVRTWRSKKQPQRNILVNDVTAFSLPHELSGLEDLVIASPLRRLLLVILLHTLYNGPATRNICRVVNISVKLKSGVSIYDYLT